MLETLDLDEARGLLARAVLTQPPGFVYMTIEQRDAGFGGCLYRPITVEEELESRNPMGPNDPRLKTGCLIGTALTLRGETRHLTHGGSVRSLHSNLPGMMTSRVMDYFMVAQTKQDTGYTWTEAYQAAERSLI